MADESCGTCKFCKLNQEETGGLCHRYPPVIVADGSRYLRIGVKADDWCGEYKKRTKGKSE